MATHSGTNMDASDGHDAMSSQTQVGSGACQEAQAIQTGFADKPVPEYSKDTLSPSPEQRNDSLNPALDIAQPHDGVENITGHTQPVFQAEPPSAPSIILQRPSTDTYDGSSTPTRGGRTTILPNSTTPAQSSNLTLPPHNASQIPLDQARPGSNMRAPSYASSISGPQYINAKPDPERLSDELEHAKKRSKSHKNMGAYEAHKGTPWYRRWLMRVKRAFRGKPKATMPPDAKKARRNLTKRQQRLKEDTSSSLSIGHKDADKGKHACQLAWYCAIMKVMCLQTVQCEHHQHPAASISIPNWALLTILDSLPYDSYRRMSVGALIITVTGRAHVSTRPHSVCHHLLIQESRAASTTGLLTKRSMAAREHRLLRLTLMSTLICAEAPRLRSINDRRDVVSRETI